MRHMKACKREISIYIPIPRRFSMPHQHPPQSLRIFMSLSLSPVRLRFPFYSYAHRDASCSQPSPPRALPRMTPPNDTTERRCCIYFDREALDRASAWGSIIACGLRLLGSFARIVLDVGGAVPRPVSLSFCCCPIVRWIGSVYFVRGLFFRDWGILRCK